MSSPQKEKDIKTIKAGLLLKKGGTKYSPEELTLLVAEFIKYSSDKKNKTLCSTANFIVFIFQEYGYFISEPTLYKYQARPEFKGIVESLRIVQRAQLENHSIHGMFGVGSGIALMLKNVGYEDKVVTETQTDTQFSLGVIPDNKEKTYIAMEEVVVEDDE